MTEDTSKIEIEAYLKGFEQGVRQGVKLVRRIVGDGYSANSSMVETIIEQAMIELRKEGESIIGSASKEST